MQIEFILYVADQEKSKYFYEELLSLKPVLHVPGMTEFQLSKTAKLGLMPENGIAKILGNNTPHPNTGNGIPRCELYLKVKNAKEYMERGIQLGAKLISPLQPRDWGNKVGYIADADGHVIAFAEEY
ncbi:MAG: lactoylglutathione lyase [Vicingaceae bacterium]|nr:lactoylglutathione lyase [Vicingaceae bacterium]